MCEEEVIMTIKILEKVLSNLEYGSSDLDSAKQGLPDYNANESSRTQIEQTESYLDDAKSDLEDLISVLKEDVKFNKMFGEF